jgi:hypothetical protein
VWSLSAVSDANCVVSAGNDGALHQWYLMPPVDTAPDAVVRITRRAEPLFVGALPFSCASLLHEAGKWFVVTGGDSGIVHLRQLPLTK